MLLTIILLGLLFLIFFLRLYSFSANFFKEEHRLRRARRFFRPLNSPPLIVAHRGQVEGFLENTLLSFKKLKELPVDMMETDLRLTKDKKLFTLHDKDVERLAGRKCLVKDLTEEEILALSWKQPVFETEEQRQYFENLSEEEKSLHRPARLDELIQIIKEAPAHRKFIIEFKDKGEELKEGFHLAYKAFKEADLLSRCLFASFQDDLSKMCNALQDEELTYSAGLRGTVRLVLMSFFGLWPWYTPKYDGVHFTQRHYLPLLSPVLIFIAKQKGLYVHYFTINEPKEFYWFFQTEVDGVITDKPTLALQLRKEFLALQENERS